LNDEIVQKYVSEDDLTYITDAPWPVVQAGDPVWFKLVVTNNGDVTLDNIPIPLLLPVITMVPLIRMMTAPNLKPSVNR
jgi:hypothetical protein